MLTKSEIVKVLGFVLLVKAILFFWVFYNFDFDQHPQDTFFSIWDRWDALHYKRIALNWYSGWGLSAQDRAFLSHFPPLYPLSIKLFSFLGSQTISGIFVSIVSILAASVALFLLAKHEFSDSKQAFRTVILFTVFPTAYFSQAVYSEGLYLFWAILCFYFIRVRASLFIASLCVAYALLTRTVAWTLCFVLCFELATRLVKQRLKMRDFLCVVFPTLALGFYLLINQTYYGNELFFMHDYQNSYHAVKLSFIPFKESFETLKAILLSPEKLFNDQHLMHTTGWSSILLVCTTLIAIFGYKLLPAIYYSYLLPYLLFVSCLTWSISSARYMYALFPICMILARRTYLFYPSAVVFLIGLLYFSRAFTQGGWAY